MRNRGSSYREYKKIQRLPEKNIVTPHILIILISYQLLASVVLSTPLPSSFDPPLFLPHLDYFKANPGYLILG